MSHAKHVIAGIDLGTTYSCLAVLNDAGRPEIVPNADGDRIMPSVVYFPEGEHGKSLVGVEAVNSLEFSAARVVSKIKRHMGDEEHGIEIDGETWTPPKISAEILKKLKDECGRSQQIRDVVVTVPAFYDETRRGAVMQAGKLAGLDVLGIINEPTAAALFYAVTHDVAGKVLVFDLGGGTFDVTIMDVVGKKVDIVCSQGDPELGGVDFDQAILDAMNGAYEAECGVPLWQTEAESARFESEAEDVKRALSRREQVRKMLHGPNGSMTFEITREEFEKAIGSHVGRTEMLVEMALDEAGLAPGDVDVVLLVGGSTRVPLVADRLRRMFGFEPTTAVNVDECVALGAAIHAGMIVEQDKPADLSDGVRAGLADIKMPATSNSYGTIHLDIESHTGRPGESNSIIIPKNTPLPCTRSEEFYTASDAQTEVKIRITQGEGDDPAFVNILAEPEFALPPNRPSGRKLIFTYSYDANQRMHCTFEDVESGRKLEVEIGMDGIEEKELAGWGGSDIGGFIVE